MPAPSTGEAVTAARLQARAEEELRQARQERDAQNERAVAAEQQAHAARAESKLKEQVRELRERLAAAQTAAGLVLPELADLSGDLGEGARGVRLAGAGIAVARQPDGAVGAAPRRPADPAARRRARRRARPRPGRRSARRLRTLGTRI
ncbi:hypothetical protein ABZ815_30065 [Nonomuraea sp. NPDC047529]|uniref:hypothetical protein n=1 Tax=Nonomuraea sp. NPDC047529 TaxID=3155623 RepID=UPI0033D24D27